MPDTPTAADRAFQAALQEIEQVRATGGARLEFHSEQFRALDRLPDSLRTLTILTHFDCRFTNVSDLSPLRDLTGLQALWLEQTAVTDLLPLRDLTALDLLSLTQTSVSDLSSLRNLSAMHTLSLSQTSVTDLAPLRRLTALNTLSLKETGVADLSPLQGLTALQYLWLDQTAVADLSPLQNLNRLETLVVSDTGVVDLSPLRNLSGLRSLWLTNNAVTDLTPLRGLTGLLALGLENTLVADLTPLQDLTGLMWLWLAGTAVSDLSPLQNTTGLQGFSFDQTAVSDIALLRNMTELHRLSLDKTAVVDLSPLLDLKQLEMLSFNQTAVSDLRPIRDHSSLAKRKENGPLTWGLSFKDTLSTRRDPQLARLAAIKGDIDRTEQTLAYLRTLPPWPEPYTPEPPVDVSPLMPLVEDPKQPELPKVRTAQAQIRHLLRHALVTRLTAQQLSELITAALHGVPATHGNELSPILQMMAEVAEVLGQLGDDPPDAKAIEREQTLRLRIAQLEAIIEKLTAALRDETEARIAAEAVAKKDGFLHSYRKSLGTAAGVGTIGLIAVGVPTAAVYFLGANHPLVQAFLTVVGKLPKT